LAQIAAAFSLADAEREHILGALRETGWVMGGPIANLTADEIRAAVVAHDVDGIDPLKEFSTVCRNGLLARQW
jgi:hypothetical protein